MTLGPWYRGLSLVWDATVVDLWTLLLGVTTKTLQDSQAFQLQRLRLQNAKNAMAFKAITTFNQLQLRHWCVWQDAHPFLSGLAKTRVDMSGDPKERQWLHQRLSLAVVRGNAASILACVQV